MTKPSSDLANALLEQHVKHELSALKGAKMRRFLAQELDELFDLAGRVTLGRITSAEQVMVLVRKVVINMEMNPDIPGVAGDMYTEALSAPIQKTTKLNEIITREQVTGFLEQALALKEQRQRMISGVMSHPVYQQMVATVVYQGVVNFLYEDNLLTKNVPGVGSMMKFGKRMANRAVPGLDESFERRFKAWLAQSLPGLIARSEEFLQKSLTDEELRDSIMEVWESVENQTIEELHEGLGDVRMQGFLVLGYEFWLQFRQTPYFEGCAEAVVTRFFEYYGDRPVLELLKEMGVEREVIMAEIDGLELPLLDVLHKEGYLEALIRRRLTAFYTSAAARKLLAQG
ncbi:hypothetical protein [Marinobacter sp.]|uniref:hypothetical protein n=1 Tax=Marinobacter sp. TaxID=50741 RepID=UPI002B46B9A7|nr:hypothetical protein [Marinobacter sp.]HKK55941.1 hypothetical protein [Marinobacter sp.]